MSQRNNLGDLGGPRPADDPAGERAERDHQRRHLRLAIRPVRRCSRTGSPSRARRAAASAATGWWRRTAGVFSFGDAAFHGSAGNIHLTKPVVGMAATPDGGGYWLVASDGGVFTYGDAAFHGSAGNIQPDQAGGGHGRHPRRRRLLAGGRRRRGVLLRRRRLPRLGGRHQARPSRWWAWPPPPTAAATGWWRRTAGCSPSATPPSTARRGRCAWPSPSRPWPPPPTAAATGWSAPTAGVFSFGDAAFEGSLPGLGVHRHGGGATRAPAPAPGYLIVTADGRAVGFGDAPQFGDVADVVAGWTGQPRGRRHPVARARCRDADPPSRAHRAPLVGGGPGRRRLLGHRPRRHGVAFAAALDAGVNHLDVAPRYGRAQELLGPLVGPVRDRLFVACKTMRHDPDGVRAQLEESLTLLRCDHFDLYQMHAVTDLDELDARAGRRDRHHGGTRRGPVPVRGDHRPRPHHARRPTRGPAPLRPRHGDVPRQPAPVGRPRLPARRRGAAGRGRRRATWG